MDSIIERVMYIIGAVSPQTHAPDRNRVQELNDIGINEMMRGNTAKAIEFFFEALEKAKPDTDLTAQSLINIGDWLRRIAGDLKTALDLFDMAEKLSINKTTLSRLYAMRAMVHSFYAEQGKDDPEGVQTNVTLLRQAISLAREAPGSEESLNAESLATHRLLGTICNFGTSEQKSEGLKIVEEFLPRVKDPGERARLNYSKACIIADDQPREAAELLQQSAEVLRQNSPLDTCAYYIRACQLFFDIGEIAKAQYCLLQAEGLSEKLLTHANSERALKDIAKLRSLLHHSS